MRNRLVIIGVVALVVLAGCGGPEETRADELDGTTTDSLTTDGYEETTESTETATETTETTRKPTTTTVADSDDDGLTDAEEEELGTDPESADTDGDGLDDGAEVTDYDTNPTEADTDGDGLDDGAEVTEYDTDPTEADTDGDGLNDSAEIEEFETDPTEADTDSDGLEDGPEVNRYNTNPREKDTDSDGLEDGPEVNRYNTNPTKADTDSDGLKDNAEINEYGTNASAADTDGDGLGDAAEINEYDTDPTQADTDNDELNDSAEVNEYDTDPKNPDTDGDNLRDGWEVNEETPNGAELPEADPLSMDIYVQFNHAANTAEIDEEVRSEVEQHWAEMDVENPDGSTGIDFHAEVDGKIDDALSYDGSGSEFRDFESQYKQELLGNRSGAYHLVLHTGFAYEDSDYSGMAESPGDFAIVDTDQDYKPAELVTHELLHNVLGRDFPNSCEDDPGHYCTGGFIGTDELGDYLPGPLERHLEETGFEESRF